MSALIHIKGDCIKLGRSFVSGALCISVNAQKLGSWPIRKKASCKAQIGEREYLITSTPILKGSSSIHLQIEVIENGTSIHSGAYNQYGMPVASMEGAKILDSAQRGWGWLFGILGTVPGALIALRLIKLPGLILDFHGGIFAGALLGAVGGLVGFLIGHRMEISLQRRENPMQPIQPAQTSALLTSMNNASLAPTLNPLRPRPAKSEDSADQPSATPDSKPGANDKPKLLLTSPGTSIPPPVPSAASVDFTEQTLGKSNDGPSGVGGWLALFCYGLVVLGPPITLWQIFSAWHQAEPAFTIFPTIHSAIIWESLGFSAIMIYGFIVGFTILGGSPKGQAFARRFLLGRLFMFIGVEVVAMLILMSGDIPAEILTGGIAAAIGGLIREGLFFTIWWFYFENSKRVRNTYDQAL